MQTASGLHSLVSNVNQPNSFMIAPDQFVDVNKPLAESDSLPRQGNNEEE